MIRLADIIGDRRPDSRPGEPVDRPGRPPAAPTSAPIDALQCFLAGLRALPPGFRPDWADLERLLGAIADALADSADLLWLAHRRSAGLNVDYLAFHQARTAILAIRLGIELGEPRERLLALGVAACVFDVALWRVPGAAAAGEWSEEGVAWREHPRRSAEIVHAWGAPAAGVLDAVLQHHERERGQGFPQGLAGTAIHPHARIIGLADTYTRLTVPPAWLTPRAPHHAVRDIVRGRNQVFPAALIKALVDVVSVFPPGTRVRLNTGERARVVAASARQPLRPQVEVLTDARGRATPARRVDLRESPFIFITGPEEDA
jgi:HD-GYP domain-containing protein (c-di-GMP phosphodiesterase class II)